MKITIIKITIHKYNYKVYSYLQYNLCLIGTQIIKFEHRKYIKISINNEENTWLNKV